MPVELTLKLLGIFLGIMARTLIPWLRKLREGKVEGFNLRYLWSTLASLILGLILTLVVFPQFDVSLSAGSFEARFKLFCLAFGFGFGWNALLLEGGQWAGVFSAKSDKQGKKIY